MELVPEGGGHLVFLSGLDFEILHSIPWQSWAGSGIGGWMAEKWSLEFSLTL
jgi:hypothetical protein